MKLKILTWNISWAYGLYSEGTAGYTAKPASHFESALQSMSEFIKNLDVDIVLLQEVDFASARSHRIEQLDYLARATRLLYRSECVSWDFPYIPYPGLKLKNQFGAMKSGGGILSRYPIRAVSQELLPKPKENHALYNLFYLSRYLQVVDIEGLRLCNLHLEAFSKDNRELQLVKLQNRLIDHRIDIAGGDFNGDIQLSAAIKDEWISVPTPEPTYPSNHPDQKLDGFIVRKDRCKTYGVKRLNSGIVSDHFPVLLELEF